MEITMILLVAAIVLLSLSIFMCRQLLLMREWFLWALMLVETFMREEAEGKKLNLLRHAGKKHFRLPILMMSDSGFQRYIFKLKCDLKEQEHTMRNYNLLVEGIALYRMDYLALQKMIEYEGR